MGDKLVGHTRHPHSEGAASNACALQSPDSPQHISRRYAAPERRPLLRVQALQAEKKEGLDQVLGLHGVERAEERRGAHPRNLPQTNRSEEEEAEPPLGEAPILAS